MIKRLSKHNDYRDIIKSCPSGVIDDIYAIEYYIQGHNETIQANFEKKGDLLEVILPSSDLETLPNGILMRRAFYKVLDASYPDGYYNLQFEDNMNVWLGEVESEEPVIPEYVTEEELAETLGGYVSDEELTETLGGYATQSWVSSQGYLTGASMSGYATKNYVDSSISDVDSRISSVENRLLNDESVIVDVRQRVRSLENAGFATETWVEEQGYAVNDEQDPFVTESAMNAVLAGNGDRVVRESDLSGFATESYVDQAIEDAIFGSEIPIPENVVEYDVHHPLVEEFGYNVDVLKRDTFDHESGGEITDRITKGLVLAYEEEYEDGAVVAMSTVEIRDGLLAAVSYTFGEEGGLPDYHEDRSYYATEDWVENQGYLTSVSMSGYATESWVSQQGFATNSSLSSVAARVSDLENGTVVPSGTATESWVQNQGYITSSALSGYATQSWVQNQGYLTSASGYATETWVENQGFVYVESLDDYATLSWVSSQGYATQSWATSQFLEESKVWTGSQAQWNALTAAQKASYTIALITQ